MNEHQRVRQAQLKAEGTQLVSVPLSMLRWLAEGLKQGRVAASPYAVMDANIYEELRRAVADGEELARINVHLTDRAHLKGYHDGDAGPVDLCSFCWLDRLESPPPEG